MSLSRSWRMHCWVFSATHDPSEIILGEFATQETFLSFIKAENCLIFLWKPWNVYIQNSLKNGKFNGTAFIWNINLWEHPKCIVWCSSASPICSFTLTITTLIQSDTNIISQICITINTDKCNIHFNGMRWLNAFSWANWTSELKLFQI